MSNKISDMTINATLPAGSFIPFVVTDPATGLNVKDNYRFDGGTYLAQYSTLIESDGSSLLGFVQAGTGAGTRTAQDKLRESISIEDFYSGTTDDATAFQRALDRVTALGGGTVHGTAPSYAFTSQCTLTRDPLPPQSIVTVNFHGAIITTSGAISALKITGGGDNVTVVEQAIVNQEANATALAAFDLANSSNVIFRDVEVIANGGVSAAYACWILRQSDVANVETGSFWTTFSNCNIKGTNGVALIPTGVRLEGAANMTKLGGLRLANVTDGILITYPPGYHNLANSVDANGLVIEGFVNAIRAKGEAGYSTVYGLQQTGGRYENGDYLLYLELATLNSQEPPIVGPNIILQSVTGRVRSPVAAITYSIYDNYQGSDAAAGVVETYKGTTFKANFTGYDGITVLSQEGYGLSWKTPSGTVATARLVGGTSTTLFELAGVGGVTLGLSVLRGISQSTARSYNIAGVSGALSAGTRAVTFAVAQPSANYRVLLTPNATVAGRLFTSAKGTGGFTINSTDAGDTATVDWFLIQD